MLRAVPVIVVALLTAGCFECHKRDARTIANVTATIEHRRGDFAYLRAFVPTGTAALIGFDAIQQAELDRLEAWRWREEQKSK